jgi:hypothetical protein
LAAPLWDYYWCLKFQKAWMKKNLEKILATHNEIHLKIEEQLSECGDINNLINGPNYEKYQLNVYTRKSLFFTYKELEMQLEIVYTKTKNVLNRMLRRIDEGFRLVGAPEQMHEVVLEHHGLRFVVYRNN